MQHARYATYLSKFNETQIVVDNDVAFTLFDQSIYNWFLQYELVPTPIELKPGIYIDGEFIGKDSVWYNYQLITIVK